MVMRSPSRCSTGAALDSQLWMVPLSLFATDRRHYTWLRRMSERLCQFSREARLHRVEKNGGSCTPSLDCYAAHWPVIQMDA